MDCNINPNTSKYMTDMIAVSYLFFLKKLLYSQINVMMKKASPTAAMATRFRTINFHWNGDFILSYWPEENRKKI